MRANRTKPTLVVMAAGLGSRYGGNKQIDPIGPNDEIIMDYSVYDAIRAGFGKVVFVINKRIEHDFKSNIISKYEKHIATDYVIQDSDRLPQGFERLAGREKPWGTAHAVMCCRHAVDTTFAVINADDFYGRSSYVALHDYLVSARDKKGLYDYCMVGFILENTLSDNGHVARGVCTVDQNSQLKGIRELTKIETFENSVKYFEEDKWIDIPSSSIVSMNAWGFTPSIFDEIENRFASFLEENEDNIEKAEFFLPFVVDTLLAEQKATVMVLPTNERWYGVTYLEDKHIVRQQIKTLIDRGIYPKHLWEEIK